LPESRLPGRTEGILEKLRAAFVKLIEPADEEIHRIQTAPKYEREMKTRIKELALEHWKARVAVFTTKVKVHNMPKFEHIKEKIELIQIPEAPPEDPKLWSAMIKKLKSVHARTLVDTWTREVSSIVTIDRAMHVHRLISQAISPLSPAIPGTDAMRGLEELHKLHNRWKEEVSNEEFKDDDILLKPLDRERFKLDPLLKERDKIDQLLAADINRKKSSMNESIIEACFSNSKWQSVDLQYAFSDHKTPASYLMELRKEVLSIAEKTNNEWKRLCNTRHAIPGYPDQTASVIDKLSSSPQWTPGYALLANQTIDIDPAKNGMLPLMKMLGFMIYAHYQSMLHQEIATM
ncbi:MAG: hypothetical protein P4L87_03520, partial [Formivibrio sp.]|nr:hypothetical protein [Formivibrio sp.]